MDFDRSKWQIGYNGTLIPSLQELRKQRQINSMPDKLQSAQYGIQQKIKEQNARKGIDFSNPQFWPSFWKGMKQGASQVWDVAGKPLEAGLNMLVPFSGTIVKTAGDFIQGLDL